MTSKEALDKIKHIDLHGRYPYPYYLKDDLEYKEVLEILDIALKQAHKQKKLLELHRELAYYTRPIIIDDKYVELQQKIKELEYDISRY